MPASSSLKCYSISLGCPKNRVDTERLLGSLGLPLLFITTPNKADFIFINTCAFIISAVQESIETIIQLVAEVEGVKSRPLIVVAGCFVSRYGEKFLKKEIPEVDVWLDSKNMDTCGETLVQALGLPSASLVMGRVLSTAQSYAWLKISDGCQHTCSFCTIPSIRGSLRSYPISMLVEESRQLLAQGVKELALVAQDVLAWGKDLGDPYGLCSLLDHLVELDGLERLRLMYLYPAGITKELLQYLKGIGTPFIPYFDVPIQHTHPDILTRMGRPFAHNPKKIIDQIRSVFPDAALRTSIITGFPGETIDQYLLMLKELEELRFQHLGVFTYKAEEGTPSAAMPNQIEEHIKIQRKEEIMELQRAISADWLLRFKDQKLSILVDSAHEDWPGLHIGRAWFQAPEIDGVTYISGPGVAPGALLEAEVIECQEYDLVSLVDFVEDYG